MPPPPAQTSFLPAVASSVLRARTPHLFPVPLAGGSALAGFVPNLAPQQTPPQSARGIRPRPDRHGPTTQPLCTHALVTKSLTVGPGIQKSFFHADLATDLDSAAHRNSHVEICGEFPACGFLRGRATRTDFAVVHISRSSAPLHQTRAPPSRLHRLRLPPLSPARRKQGSYHRTWITRVPASCRWSG